jgi:hypothetical protein
MANTFLQSMIVNLPTAEDLQPQLDRLEANPGSVILVAIEQPAERPQAKSKTPGLLVGNVRRKAFPFLKFTARSAIVALCQSLIRPNPLPKSSAANRPPKPPVVSKNKKGSGKK